jgi:hypothetical protein
MAAGSKDSTAERGGTGRGRSARSVRDERLAGFAQGFPGDTGKPGVWQFLVLHGVSGLDRSCPGASDDQALGILGQWGRAESWVVAQKLTVLREMAARYPAADDERDDELAREVSLMLSISVTAARNLIKFAVALGVRVPGIGKALGEGLLDPGKARMVCEELSVLDDPDQLARAEEIILAGMTECKTWAALQRLAQKAVCTVDPEGARKRREKEERENARVRFWREAAGTCGLMGTGLPTDEALAAHAHVEGRAREYQAAGVRRRIEILRVAAYLDLLNGVSVEQRIARFAAEDTAQVAREAAEAERYTARTRSGNIGGPGPEWEPCAGCDDKDCTCGTWPAEAPCENCTCAPCRCGGTPAEGGGDGGGSGSGGGTPGTPKPGGGGVHDPGSSLAGRVNLTLAEMDIPLLTALGLLRRPGEARDLGALDPALARKLAEAAARHPASTFCLTIVNKDGHAIGHGCLKPSRGRDKQAAGPPGGFPITRRDRAGPPGGYGSWTVTLPGRAGTWAVDLHPVPAGQCGHQYQSARHDPGQLLRHLVEVRDGKCGFPACSRPARECDLEHAIPFHQGGKTCGCNCWSCSRSCHRVKQSPRWSVTEVKPGFHQWTTPSGRTYTQEPWRYPA